MNATRRASAVALMSLLVSVTSAAQTPPPARTVDIRATDGVVLRGTLFASSRPSPAVLLLHQCDEQRKVWDALGARLAAVGITALSVDYRGYGESGGPRYEKLDQAALNKMITEQWPSDIDVAFAYLSKQPGVDTTRMAASGGSCGVDNALQLARRHKNVKALALLAGGADRAGRQFIAAPGAPPIFAAAAADDKYADFVAIMGWFTALSSNPQSRMAQYRDGGHAAVVFAKHPGLADTIALWFAGVLKTRGGALPKTNGVPMKADAARVLHEIDQPGGAIAVGKRLAAARSKQPGAQLFSEFFVNSLGYEHLAANDVAGAFEIMKLNVAAYPTSPNAMDSLGDIHLARGDSAAALDAAKKTLVLLDKDTVDTPERKAQIREAAVGKITRLSSR